MADSYNSPNSGFNHEYRKRFEVRRPAKPPEMYAGITVSADTLTHFSNDEDLTGIPDSIQTSPFVFFFLYL